MELSTILVIMNTVILISLGNVTRQLADQNNKNDEIKLFLVLILTYFWKHITVNIQRNSFIWFLLQVLLHQLYWQQMQMGMMSHQLFTSRQSVNDYPFRNTSLPWKQRVDDLVSRLTLDEITQQVTLLQPSILKGIQFQWHLSSGFVHGRLLMNIFAMLTFSIPCDTLLSGQWHYQDKKSFSWRPTARLINRCK